MDRQELGGGGIGYVPDTPPEVARERSLPVASFQVDVALPGRVTVGHVWLDDTRDRATLVATINRRPEILATIWPVLPDPTDDDLHVLALQQMLEVLAFGSTHRGLLPDDIADAVRDEAPASCTPVRVTGVVQRNGDTTALFQGLGAAGDIPQDAEACERAIADMACAAIIRKIGELRPPWDPFINGW